MKLKCLPLTNIASIAILLFICFIPVNTALAGDEMKKNVFSLHAGYGHMPWGTGALTSSSDSYVDKLSSGFTIDLQYDYRVNPLFAIGVIVSQYNAKGKHTEGSDHLFTTLFAPQVSLYPLNGTKWILRCSFGIGYLDYKNDGRVFGKKRKTSGGTISAIVGARLGYKLSSHWGINVDANLVSGSLHSYNANYHGKRIKVKPKSDDHIKLFRCNLSAGLSYHF